MSDEDDLLGQVASSSDDDLGRGVAKTEGFNGGRVTPVYSDRQVKYLHVSESELNTINLANIAAASSFSISSFLFALWLDIFKDTKLAESIPETTQETLSYVQPILLVASVLFLLVGGVSVLWRKSQLKIIRQESSNP
jgi:protein tyrosine phosphatase